MAYSPARSRSRAPSRPASRALTQTPAPIVVEMPERPPIVIDESVLTGRPKSRGPPGVSAPGLSGGRGMFKRLIVACDGTWLNSDNGMVNGKLPVPSNVTRISRAIKTVSQDGIPQIVNYHYGLGTQGGKLDRLISGTTGEGLGDTVREAYSFLANNYHHGDEIFLLGFSRGAFTARSIAGLIGEIGLLTKKGLHALPEIHKDVQHRRDPRYVAKNPDIPFPNKPSAEDPRYADELERRGLTRLDIPIKAIAVWDTVGSLGTPRIGWLTKVGLQSGESKEMAFYDTKLHGCVENAFQALALDEKRSAFSPAVWEKGEGNRTTLRQVWFPGVHSNVGGGYSDQQLANITLAWMMSQLEPLLDMRDEYLFEQDDETARDYHKTGQKVRPWSFGEIYNSMTGLFSLGGGSFRTPGMYREANPFTGRPTDRPLRQTNEYIHPSVRARFRLDGPGVSDKGLYECRALTDNYKLVVDYGTQNTKSGDPDVFWKLKFRDEAAVKVLPEAPLWRLERELAKKDPDTYHYVRRPPATGQKRRKQRPVSAGIVGNGKLSSGTRRSHVADDLGPRGSTRRSFVADDDRRASRRSYIEPSEATMKRTRSRSRAASMDRETDIRENMPHRRPKDKTWWDGVSQAGPRSPDPRSPRRSSMRV
ncbi:hypothetical protein BU24DRAFT_22468 [Aaosphaeria arxii CBS 175.79]|uniref:T6SS Phospholipase effector Tle1-like catalytic domain-containing protein n=1 Tax=Aaosphaeria arxii CBS 175.79 TaxID=1450172 RepID=A0A6A5Y9R3_9PLEO|nr:uncharacterized protein BU24DRAFT_22468 [Aaosphaeria arxii CBS 175.79]KAF2021550.1 hypothetical protein BU24DRAFT_22468 [Aaosphaeria arxii CBS 175.79]